MDFERAALGYLEQLQQWGLADLPIPLLRPDKARRRDGKECTGKTPVVCHREGQWDARKVVEYFSDRLRCGQHAPYLGLVLKSLFVLDCDTHEVARRLEARFPCLRSDLVPKQSTRKGKHYVLMRTPLADYLGLTDSARGLREGGELLKVDIKTVTSTGTGGILSVWPSPEKRWQVPLLGLRPPPLPEELARWIHARKIGKGSGSGSGARAPRVERPLRLEPGPGPGPGHPAPDEEPAKRAKRAHGGAVLLDTGELLLAPEPRADAEGLRALGLSPGPRVNVWAPDGQGRSAPRRYSWWEKVAPCPLCKKPGGHKSNQYSVRWDASSGEAHVGSFSTSCHQAAGWVPVPRSKADRKQLRAHFERCMRPVRDVAPLRAWLEKAAPALAGHARLGWTTGPRWYLRAEEGSDYLEVASPLAGSGWRLRLRAKPWADAKHETSKPLEPPPKHRNSFLDAIEAL
jgi:hypothetical protein